MDANYWEKMKNLVIMRMLLRYVPARKRVPGYQINQQLSKVKFAVLVLTLFAAITIGLVRKNIAPINSFIYSKTERCTLSL